MITLNQTKNYLQFANSDYDSLLSEIIAYSIAHIENYVGYTLSETEETNVFQGTGRQWLSIPRPNITEISEVKIDDVVAGSTLYSIKNNMVFKKDKILHSAAAINQQLASVSMQMSAQDLLIFIADIEALLVKHAIKSISSQRLVAMVLSSTPE